MRAGQASTRSEPPVSVRAMRRRYKLLAVLVGVAAGLAAMVVVLGPRLIDSDRVKGELTALVKTHTGLDLHVGGQVRLHVFPDFAVTLTDIRIANPPGFAAPQLARLPWLQVDLDALALLSGRVTARAIGMNGLTVDLERDADGRGNWEGATGSDQGSEPAPGAMFAGLAFGGLRLSDGTVHWRAGDEDVDVTGIEVHTGAARGLEGIDDLRMQATLPVSGVTLDVRGDLRPIDAGGGFTVPALRASVRADRGAGLRVDGTLDGKLEARFDEQRLTLASMEATAHATGSHHGRLRLELSGDLAVDLADGRLKESALTVRVSEVTLAGVTGRLTAEGVATGNLPAGEITFRGIQFRGDIGEIEPGGARVPFIGSSTLSADLARRRLSAPGLTVARSGDAGGPPFAFQGDLELVESARTLSVANMRLSVAALRVAGDMTARATPSPAGVEGVVDVRVQDRPLAGSFAVSSTPGITDAFDVRADAVVDLDLVEGGLHLHGKHALVLRARARRGDREGAWRIEGLEAGARVRDGALPGGGRTIRLLADLDVDLRDEALVTDNLRVSVDENRIAGSVRARGFASPAVRVDLEADAIDADRLGLPIAAGADDTASATPLDMTVKALRALDVAGELRVKRLTVNGVVMENVRLTAGDDG